MHVCALLCLEIFVCGCNRTCWLAPVTGVSFFSFTIWCARCMPYDVLFVCLAIKIFLFRSCRAGPLLQRGLPPPPPFPPPLPVSISRSTNFPKHTHVSGFCFSSFAFPFADSTYLPLYITHLLSFSFCLLLSCPSPVILSLSGSYAQIRRRRNIHTDTPLTYATQATNGSRHCFLYRSCSLFASICGALHIYIHLYTHIIWQVLRLSLSFSFLLHLHLHPNRLPSPPLLFFSLFSSVSSCLLVVAAVSERLKSAHVYVPIVSVVHAYTHTPPFCFVRAHVCVGGRVIPFFISGIESS